MTTLGGRSGSGKKTRLWGMVVQKPRMKIKGTIVVLAMGMSLLTALLVGGIVLQSRDYHSAETAGVAPDQLVIDVQQEAGSWDAIKPAAPSHEQQRAADSLLERLDEAGNPSSGEDAGIYPEDDPFAYLTLEEFGAVTRPSKVNGMETGVLPEDDTYTYSDLSESATVIERLERQIDSLLGEAARDPSRTTPSLNREIERLDDQIDMLRFNAMKDTSGGSPSYHAQRAADSLQARLEGKINSILAEAANDPSANLPQLNREIERLDYQIDMLRLAAMGDTSVARLTSSEPIVCGLADYRNTLGHELFDEAWRDLLGRTPFSEPTICQIDKYARRHNLEEALFNEMWQNGSRVESVKAQMK